MSTSAADPADLQTYVTTAGAALRDLTTARAAVVRAANAFRSLSTVGLSDGGTGAAVAGYVTDAEELDRSVVTVRQAFLRADSGPGTHTIDDGIIAAALRADGVAIPTGPPITVETPSIVGPPVDSGVADDPVNVANGNFFEVETDIDMPGRAVSAAWVRTYGSRRFARGGALGRGWSCWADCSLLPVGDDLLRWERHDGAVLDLPVPPPGSSAPLPEGSGRIVGEGDGHVVELPGSRERWRFDAAGRPVEVRVFRMVVVLTWRDGRLTGLTDPASGRGLTIAWDDDAARIVAVTSDDGRRAAYAYDHDGDLVGVERPAGACSYEVDGGLVLGVVDADGIALVRNTYDDDGRVLSQTSPDGRTSRYVYRPGLRAVVTDDEGSAFNAYEHDLAGRLVAVTDDVGGTTRREFGPDGRLAAVSQPGGQRIVAEHDEDGNVVAVTDPAEGRFGATYDELGRMTELVDRTGRRRHYAYTGDLRTPVAVTDPAGTTRIEVSEDDLPLLVDDADGVRTSFAWTRDAQLAEVTTPAGTTRMTYDAAGSLVGLVAADGSRVSWEVDAAGRVIAQTDPRGGVLTRELSPAGRVRAVTDPGGGRYETTWGAHGNVASVTDPLGSVLGFGYDSHGNTTSMVAPDGRTFRFGYDGLGRLTESVAPSGASHRREYDLTGEPISEVTGSGARVAAEHDALGRTTRIVAANGRTAERTYDAEGRVLREVDADGGVTTLEHDEAGRLSALVQPDGGRSTFTWSPAGRLVAAVSPAGRRTRYEYDPAGRVARVVHPDGTVDRFERDGLGRVVRQARDDGPVATVTYDGLGAVTAYDDGSGGASTILRDWLGQPREVREGEEIRRYDYDLRGALVAAVDPGGFRTALRYDECGRLVASTGPLGGRWTFGYDADGRPASVTDPAGRERRLERDADGHVVAAVEADGSGLRFWRDASEQVVGVGAADADEPEDRLELDGFGRPRSATGAEGRTTVAYAGPDVRELDGPSGSLRWDYDADGRVAAIAAGDGARAEVTRDAAGEVVEVAGRAPSAPSARWSVQRDPAGQLASAVRVGAEDGDILSWTWDAGGRLLSETGPRGHRRYEYDEAGQLLSSVDDDGATTYAYDGAGRRVSESRGDGTGARYGWDRRGRLVEVTRTTDDGETTIGLRYDALGLLCRVGERRVVADPNAPGCPVRVVDGEIVLEVGGASVVVDADGTTRPAPEHVRDPFGLVLSAAAAGTGAGGELDVLGLLVMGERVLDPSTRAFLSPDPLLAVAGRPGVENPYAFAWNDPTRYADPLGLRPLTLDALHQQWESKARGTLGNAWQAIKKDPWGTLGAVAVLAAGVGLEFVPGCQGVATGILIGAGSAIVVGLATGTFDPRTVMMGGLVGGLTMGVGSVASGAVSGTMGSLAVGATAGAGAGAVGSIATSLVTGEPITPLSVAAGAAGGAVGGGFGGLAGPVSGSAARAVGDDAPAFLSGAARQTSYYGMNAAGGAVGSATGDVVQGKPITGADLLVGAGTGAAGGRFGDHLAEQANPSATGMTTVRQTSYFGPKSYVNAITHPGPNARYVGTSAGVGVAVGSSGDIGKHEAQGGGGGG